MIESYIHGPPAPGGVFLINHVPAKTPDAAFVVMINGLYADGQQP